MGKSKKTQLRERQKAQSPASGPTSIEQMEERLIRNLLAGALSLHILKNSRRPTSQLLQDLLDLEVEVGRFVGEVIHHHAEGKAISTSGALTSALSFIPIHPRAPRRAHEPRRPKQHFT